MKEIDNKWGIEDDPEDFPPEDNMEVESEDQLANQRDINTQNNEANFWNNVTNDQFQKGNCEKIQDNFLHIFATNNQSY